MTRASLQSALLRASFTALTLALVACGGGGGGSSIPTAPGGGGGVGATPTPSATSTPTSAPTNTPASIPAAIAGSWTDTAAGDNMYDPTSGLIVGTNGASRSLALNSDGTYDYKYYMIQAGIYLYAHIKGTVTVDPATQTLVLSYVSGTIMQPGNTFTPTGNITKPTTFSYATSINPVDNVTPQLTITELTQNGGTYNYAEDGTNGAMTFIVCTKGASCPSPAY